MPNTKWETLSGMQIGRYAEYYAKMEVASYGMEVYTSEVDDHGIDFIVKNPKSSRYYEVQVKSIRHNGYVYMTKRHWDINRDNLFLILLIFEEGSLPNIYLIPASAWKHPDEVFKDKDYPGLKSEPEFGLNLALKHFHLLEKYRMGNNNHLFD